MRLSRVPLVVVAASLVWALVAAPAEAQRRGPKVLVRATADPAFGEGPRMPESFLGYSFEIQDIHRQLGLPAPLGPNQALAGVFAELRRVSGSAPTVRIGGGSQDSAWWNPTRGPSPPEMPTSIDEPMLGSLGDFLRRTGSKLIFGLNLVSSDPQVAAATARAVQDHVGAGRVLTYELGNEPDFYPSRPLAPQVEADDRKSRPRDYSPADHEAEYARAAAAVRAAGVTTGLAGPSAEDPVWRRKLDRFVRVQRRHLNTVSVHSYVGTACKGSRPTTVGILLQDDIVQGGAKRVAEPVRIARRHGLPVRVTETNSLTCGGRAGVSNTFASALWSLDWAFSLAFVGARGINFHSSPAWYRPWYTGFGNPTWQFIPEALVYGNLAFAEAAPTGSTILPSAVLGQRVHPDAGIKTWATLSRDRRTVRMLVDYKAGFPSGVAVLRVPGATRSATVKRLLAPSPFSFGPDVRWAGRSIPDGSYDGRLRGRHEVQRVRRGRDRTFRVRMKPYSAALVTFRLARPARRR